MELKDRQAACAKVEKRMLDFLLQFHPADDLKLGDAKSIAMFAREIAFDEFSPKTGP